MTEETGERNKKREIPPVAEFRNRVDRDVEDKSPREEAIRMIEEQTIQKIKDPNDKTFGRIGQNYRTALSGLGDGVDGKPNIGQPAKANEVFYALKGVYEEANIDGGKFEVKLPENTPAEKRQEAIQKELVRMTNELEEKLKHRESENLRNQRAELRRMEEVARDKFGNPSISRFEARRFAYELERKRIGFDREVVAAAKKVGNEDFVNNTVAQYRSQWDTPPPGRPREFGRLPVDEQSEKTKTIRESIISTLTKVRDDVKDALPQESLVFKEIAQIDLNIDNKRRDLRGAPEKRKADGSVEKPEKTGIFQSDAQKACQAVSEIKKLQLDRQAKIGEVRIQLAEKRMALADKRYKDLKEKHRNDQLGLLGWSRVPAWFETKAAWLNHLKEKVVVSVGKVASGIGNQIDIINDSAVPKDVWIEERFSGSEMSQRPPNKKETTPKSKGLKDILAGVKNSETYKEIGRKRKGWEARNTAKNLESWKKRVDSVYNIAWEFKDGIRRLFVEHKTRIKEKYATEEWFWAYTHREAVLKRWDRMAEHKKNMDERLAQNPLYRMMEKDLEKKVVWIKDETKKKADTGSTPPTPTTPVPTPATSPSPDTTVPTPAAPSPDRSAASPTPSAPEPTTTEVEVEEPEPVDLEELQRQLVEAEMEVKAVEAEIEANKNRPWSEKRSVVDLQRELGLANEAVQRLEFQISPDAEKVT